MLHLAFDPLEKDLPQVFYTLMPPEKVAPDPQLVHYSPQAAALLGLEDLDFKDPDFAQYFSGNKILKGSNPLALVYGGHQFGVWAGQLGDGRALSLGQIKNQKGENWDIQLKGAGQTPYSRMGDGRAVLRSSIREYLCSEHMHALGIPSTRALCLVTTGETVRRETLEPGAIVTRLSPSFFRLGHFEYFYSLGEVEHVKTLADYIIENFYPKFWQQKNQYELWFEAVVKRTAELMAQWQAVGFAHGVMNTDNFSILGLTLDYGPFGFLEKFDPSFICNHSDHHGRYAFGNQPHIGLWNCQTFAYSLQELINLETLKEILGRYENYFTDHYQFLAAQKLGFKQANTKSSQHWQQLLKLMQEHEADYTNTFRLLSHLTPDSALKEEWSILFQHDENANSWLEEYFKALGSEAQNPERLNQMQRVNPKYVLRNWVAEKAIRASEDLKDFSILDTVFKLCTTPYDEHPAFETYAKPAPVEYQNLCVSCSS